MDLFVKVYELSNQLPKEERFNLCLQIRKDVVSIPSNIAEGCSKSTDAHFKTFLETAIGSSFELETQLVGITLVFPYLKQHVESSC